MVLIQLGSKGYAMVDDEDAERVSRHKWHMRGFYPGRTERIGGKIRVILLHHFIIGRPPFRMVVDHANGNKLDNRRQNLRFATYSQNGQNNWRYRTNKSGYKGVWWSQSVGSWMSCVQFHGQTISLGKFPSAHDAHLAYRAKIKELFGEFANDGNGPVE